MIRIYELLLGQRYEIAYRQGNLIAKTNGMDEAMSIMESLTNDSYQCFSFDDY